MKPKSYKPEEIREEWNKYIFHCKEYMVEVATNAGVRKVKKPRIPTIGGFMIWLDIDNSTWENYRKAEGYEEYFRTIKTIDDLVLNGKLDSLINGDGNTTGIIFDLKANYGINETNFVNNSGEVNVKVTYVNNKERKPE